MDIYLEVDEPFAAAINTERLEQAVQTALQLTNRSGQSVAISVTDAETVQQLNLEYRHINAPTDVLSFENTPDPDFPDFPQEELAGHLGDIVIAYPVAQAQAQAAGHATMDEVMLLTVHGVLHLLGFDHDTDANKAQMWELQQTIMRQLGLPHVQPTEN